MDYYSPFLGPEGIFLFDVPQGALTCMALTLTVLADFVPFRGLLLTVLGSQSNFMVVEPQGALTCRSSIIVVLADSGPFRALLLGVLETQRDLHD